jgi:hypothetical protein
MGFSASIDMPALRKAAASYHRRRLRHEARQRLRRRLTKPFTRLRSVLADRLRRQILRTEQAVRAAQDVEIAANAAQVDRLAAAAIIGSLAARAQIKDLADDRVGRARREAAMSAMIRVQERTLLKE